MSALIVRLFPVPYGLVSRAPVLREGWMAEGRIVSFNSEKGHGFIAPDDGGPDLFVHGASIETRSGRAPQEGQRVTFTVEPGADGPHAVKVTPVEERPRTSADDNQQVRHVWFVALVLAAPVLLVLVVAYALVAPSAGWWSPSWLPLAVGALIAAAYVVGKLKS